MQRPKKFVPEPFEYHQEIEFTIDTLTNLGQGLGRVDGWVVIVPSTLPGETIRARVYRNHKNYSDADLVEILTPSADRIEPTCPLFGQCGGCQYQNLSYPEQLSWKQRQVAELLEHMAGVEFPVNPVIPSPRQYHYRSKITPHFQKPRGGKIGAIGFLIANRRQQILDVPECPIAMEPINAALDELREQVHRRASSYKRGATLLLRASADGQVITDPKSTATERVGELEFKFPAGDFFQNNPFILPAFTDYVREQAVAGGSKFLVDAYCGSGLFTLTAAPAFERATGIEVSEGSIRWAKENAASNGINNCEFLAGEVEDLFASVTFPGAETSIIIDPPRKGSSAEFLEQLFRFGPRSVVYVSCNPSTQMRDLKLFTEAGYELTAVQPFDLFPQTRHLECVMTLTKG
ncbi:MAG: class I SAM-dependent RNA methyltransferase [Verrucomicrobiales bacterium]